MVNSGKKPDRIKLSNRLRLFWRRHPGRWWNVCEWPVVCILGLAALTLGCIGFAKHSAFTGLRRSLWDLIYLSLQLFLLESGSVDPPVGLELNIARFLAPFVSGYTAVQALAVIFREQIQLLRARMLKDHVVVCGLGETGILLAEGYQDQGYRVVVIEEDAENDAMARCRDQSIVVLIGDATETNMLLRARVSKARYLIAACGSDELNAEIAVQVSKLLGNVKRPGNRILTCMVHLLLPQLCYQLQELEIQTRKNSQFRLEFFNIYDSGARALLQKYPAFSTSRTPRSARPHIVVIGLGRMGESLVIHAARQWRSTYADTHQRLRVTVIDREARMKKESLLQRYEIVEKLCEIIAYEIDIHSAEFQQADFLFPSEENVEGTIVYICLRDESFGLFTALHLLHRTRVTGKEVSIVVRMTHDIGIPFLIQDLNELHSRFERLHVFGLYDQQDILLGGTHEVLARALHEVYLQSRQEGRHFSERPSTEVPWEKLPEEFKESNRNRADRICKQLEAVGCSIEPLRELDPELFSFTEDEVELMAKMEHEDWRKYMISKGWKHGPMRNDKKRTTPYLVLWEDLPEEAKKLTRDTVRGYPTVLARTGFQIYRISYSVILVSI